MEVSVIYGTHGDEKAGRKAAQQIISSTSEFKKGVHFILANEKAFNKNARSVDADLNRSFPGDPESDIYEERIASKLNSLVKDTFVIDLHETVSEPVPFALYCWNESKTLESLISLNVDKAVEISYTSGCGINHFGGVEVETGPKNTEKSAEMAEKILRNFLKGMKVLDGDSEKRVPEIYTVFDSIAKPEVKTEPLVSNFSKVSENDKIAISEDGNEIYANQEFFPILVSDSYQDKLGFKSIRCENLERSLKENFKNKNQSEVYGAEPLKESCEEYQN